MIESKAKTRVLRIRTTW